MISTSETFGDNCFGDIGGCRCCAGGGALSKIGGDVLSKYWGWSEQRE